MLVDAAGAADGPSLAALFCIIIQFPDGRGYPVTARLMSDRERRRYQEWAKR